MRILSNGSMADKSAHDQCSRPWLACWSKWPVGIRLIVLLGLLIVLSQRGSGQNISTIGQKGGPVNGPVNGPDIAAELKSSGGRILIEISNGGSLPLSLTLDIALGTDTEIADAGRVNLRLEAQRTESYELRGLPPSSPAPTHYVLSIHSSGQKSGLARAAIKSPLEMAENGRNPKNNGPLLLYRHAVLRQSSDPLPTEFLTVTTLKKGQSRLASTRSTEKAEEPAPPPVYENFVPKTEIQLQARLLAGTDNPEIAILSFELFSERPVTEATLEIRIGKFEARKPVSISGQSLVQFELPPNLDAGDEEASIHYRLASRERRTLLEGDLLLAKLIEDDGIVLSDIQFDQPSYPAGASVRMILQLNGRSRSGFTIEITVRDGSGQIFHRDQQLFPPGSNETSPPFNFNLPGDLEGPVVVEYRILNTRSSGLYDAGDRSFPIVN